MANVHGLFSGKNSDKDDDDDDDSNNRYVGGVDSRGGGSGLAVEPNHDDVPSARDSLFRQAENVGPDGSDEVRRTITMYRSGFVVDNGAYRRLDDPANADFLRSLAQGMTPRELLGEAGAADVTVGLIDKRNEDYVEEFQSFSGTGASLGTATTNVEGDSVDPAALPETPPAPDATRPTTSIQVRLANGQGRRVIRLNLNQSVLDLAAHLRDAAPNHAPFRLLAGFPPKPLTDWNQSVEEAGLKGASVSMQSAA